MTFSFIIELSAIIVIAAALAYLFNKLKQPILISYILTGFIVGPAALGLISSYVEIQALSELGIAFLLYAIGAELDINKIKSIKTGIILTTIVQVLLCFALGFAASYYLLAYTLMQSILIGAIISISSTAVVMKYLTDQNLGSTLRARIMLGILLIQDFLTMFFLPLIVNSSTHFDVSSILFIIGKITFIVAIAMLINFLVFKTMIKDSVKKRDLFFMISLASCFGFIWISSLLDFSIIIGAFIGGLILTNYPFNLEVMGNISEIKMFFSMFFFVFLGMQITNVTNLSLGLFVMLIVLSYMIKPAILFIGTLFSKYDEDTSFYASTGLSQISEFSLVFVQVGIINGIFSDSLGSNLIIFIALSMILTPYILQYNYNLNKFSRPITKSVGNSVKRIFSIKTENISNIGNMESTLKDHVIIFGLGRMGSGALDGLLRDKRISPEKIVVIDDDPEPVLNAIKKGVYGLSGQADNDEILERLNLDKAKLVIITIPFYDINTKILQHINTNKTNVFARAYYVQEAYDLYQKGVKFVVVPQVLATNQLLKEVFTYLESGGTQRSTFDKFYIESLKFAADNENMIQRHHRYRDI